ncbi:uncharacterized protein N7458_001860 [Penicillium daleae]|uniref:Zn(2)-C6 fungal-type domain-containing protein n=1 Tax=Penicillium daleae TaxID=63821 RepID=A0AAD6CDJ5_9EURO|nr:uncharacterized protein N7458_001860 [Penicillium daleae]KAJ5460308.1 hypothetical protein N7458_001860 [Penicillium daleae]
MDPGRRPVLRYDESARPNANERRLPVPVNHFNTLRSSPLAPPSSWGSLPTIFCPGASSEAPLKIVLEDPSSGQQYREKRIRSQEELDSQKEGMRILKDYGGACAACYRSKKRCGPGDPCPPCAARDRECVRLNRYDGETVSAGGQPVPTPTQPISTSSQSVSTSFQSVPPPTQPVSAPVLPPSPTVRSETLTLDQMDPPNDRPSLPESTLSEPALDEDLPSLGLDPPEDYFDPFRIDLWEDGMDCINSAWENPSFTLIGNEGGHLTT